MFVTETQIRVRYGETDPMGYLYYGNYAQYYEVGRAEAIRTLGLSYKEMEETVGIMMPVMSLQMRYVRPAYYDDLLTVFWENHDPTTLNRQGPDVGTQYRSAIFYHNDEQKAAAISSKDEWEKSGRFRRAIVTEITPATDFFVAEDYHQQYLEKRGLSSCHI